MDIPEFLIDKIREGNAVLFLGSGASKGALNSQGKKPPDGPELRDLLADKFLGNGYNQSPLHQVAEYAISESSLTDVQEYLRKIFIAFEPAPFHLQMCDFLWYGIATTNYDLIIEKAYEKNKEALQVPIPFIKDGDRIDDKMRDSKAVPLLKLHGCISRIEDCPLILSTDQYINYPEDRKRIYGRLEDWAYEHSFVFVGHSLQDPDLRAIILRLSEYLQVRPRFFIVGPEDDPVKKRFWETKKITVLTGTMEEFFGTLEHKIPRSFRGIKIPTPLACAISERFVKTEISLSDSCRLFIEKDIDYVKTAKSDETITPSNFYKGINPRWSAIESDLDVKRRLYDIVVSENFSVDEAAHLPRLEMVLIKGHAGAGKSVLLQRLAWDIANDTGQLCIYLRPHGYINTSALKDLISLCNERIYLFVDNAGDHVKELLYLCNNVREYGLKLTVIMAERTNEWNMTCELLEPFLTNEYELQYLTSREIEQLVHLLEKHGALGTLQDVSFEERIEAFAKRAGRQLLVALHEATLGRPFEEIVVDEYKNIVPAEAQQIYLTICVLHRLGVSVRAGIISRLHGVPFVEFQTRFFKPLEYIVRDKFNEFIKDYEYRARHRHIAEIVFEEVLKDNDQKYDVYVRCMKALNIDYSADRKAFWRMVNGRTLLQLFPTHEMVKALYEIAHKILGENPYLFHQMAVYEMNRPAGNLGVCSEYLAKAARLARHDLSIQHSRAELLIRLAEMAKTDLQKEEYLKDATAIVATIKNAETGNPYAYHTLIKIGLMKIQKLLDKEDEKFPQVMFEDLVKEVESVFFEGYQRFPDDPYLCAEEARFASLLADKKRALIALEKAFKTNPRSSFIALRLVECLKERKEYPKAKQVLKEAIDANPGEKRLHYAYAKLLLYIGGASAGEMTYHLRRAFTNGDKNYDAQLLYGRQLFIEGNQKYKEVFEFLKTVSMNPALQRKLFYPLEEVFYGTVKYLYISHCFIYRHGDRDGIFAHQNNVSADIWERIRLNSRVSFKIAFTVKGPSAYEINVS